MCQIGLYLFSDKNAWKYVKTFTFLLLLLGHLFIFPQFFFPESDLNEVKCGSEFFGITLTFWVIGGGATIILHCIYCLMKTFSGDQKK